jgi:NADPH:quinone reductase-like Zn-dependent oxidoreductase
LVRTRKSGVTLTLPLTLGSEISGIVEKTGDTTRGFAVGDEVFGATKTQAFADSAPRADAVIDTVGSKTQDQLFALAKPRGVIVSAVVPLNKELASRYSVRTDFFHRRRQHRGVGRDRGNVR